jgi:hypothetical protein
MTTTPGRELADGVDLPSGLAALTEPPTAGAAVWPISAAAAFVEFVIGADGHAILADYGFEAP